MKITATYEDTEENMQNFAMLLGWSPTVNQFNEETHTEETVSNPFTLSEFLTEWANNTFTREISVPTKRQIKQAALQTAKTSEQELDVAVKQNLTVSVESNPTP